MLHVSESGLVYAIMFSWGSRAEGDGEGGREGEGSESNGDNLDNQREEKESGRDTVGRGWKGQRAGVRDLGSQKD